MKKGANYNKTKIAIIIAIIAALTALVITVIMVRRNNRGNDDNESGNETGDVTSDPSDGDPSDSDPSDSDPSDGDPSDGDPSDSDLSDSDPSDGDPSDSDPSDSDPSDSAVNSDNDTDYTITPLRACFDYYDEGMLIRGSTEGGDPYIINLTLDQASYDDYGHIMHDSEPVLTPMQCEALCEDTGMCWGYTFAFEYQDANSTTITSSCDLKAYMYSVVDSDAYDNVLYSDSLGYGVHNSGEKCITPAYTDAYSDNYYIQDGNLSAESNNADSLQSSLLKTINTKVFSPITDYRAAYVSRNAAKNDCKNECTDFDGEGECIGFVLMMINDNGGETTWDNEWQCRLFKKDAGTGFSTYKTANDGNCPVSGQIQYDEPGLNLPDDYNNCTLIGRRLHAV